MSVMPVPAAAERFGLPVALSEIAARAVEFDRAPRFPTENFDSLRRAGMLESDLEFAGGRLAREIALVRAVAGVDASTARILDGHLNGVERLAMLGVSPQREAELQLLGDGG